MLPSTIHVLFAEQHRREMLAEAERQRLIRQIPKQPRRWLHLLRERFKQAAAEQTYSNSFLPRTAEASNLALVEKVKKGRGK